MGYTISPGRLPVGGSLLPQLSALACRSAPSDGRWSRFGAALGVLTRLHRLTVLDVPILLPTVPNVAQSAIESPCGGGGSYGGSTEVLLEANARSSYCHVGSLSTRSLPHNDHPSCGKQDFNIEHQTPMLDVIQII